MDEALSFTYQTSKSTFMKEPKNWSGLDVSDVAEGFVLFIFSIHSFLSIKKYIILL